MPVESIIIRTKIKQTREKNSKGSVTVFLERPDLNDFLVFDFVIFFSKKYVISDCVVEKPGLLRDESCTSADLKVKKSIE
jgi:hypothetical protein